MKTVPVLSPDWFLLAMIDRFRRAYPAGRSKSILEAALPSQMARAPTKPLEDLHGKCQSKHTVDS